MSGHSFKGVQGTHMQHLLQRRNDSREQMRREIDKGYSTKGMKPRDQKPARGKKK